MQSKRTTHQYRPQALLLPTHIFVSGERNRVGGAVSEAVELLLKIKQIVNDDDYQEDFSRSQRE